ncbi:hypothetical protein BDZ97DRAFT_1762096 [Flammula alnicola]|nr:hypothetical protein BDZ97DRAFT_1762096 [Flammula alnicola]
MAEGRSFREVEGRKDFSCTRWYPGKPAVWLIDSGSLKDRSVNYGPHWARTQETRRKGPTRAYWRANDNTGMKKNVKPARERGRLIRGDRARDRERLPSSLTLFPPMKKMSYCNKAKIKKPEGKATAGKRKGKLTKQMKIQKVSTAVLFQLLCGVAEGDGDWRLNRRTVDSEWQDCQDG